MTLQELKIKRVQSIKVVCTLGLAATPLLKNFRDAKKYTKSHNINSGYTNFFLFLLYFSIFTIPWAIIAFVIHFFKLIYFSVKIYNIIKTSKMLTNEHSFSFAAEPRTHSNGLATKNEDSLSQENGYSECRDALPIQSIVEESQNVPMNNYKVIELHTLERYGEFISVSNSLPRPLWGRWYRSISGKSLTLILSAEQLKAIYSGGGVLESRVIRVMAANNPDTTKNEYPFGWTIIADTTTVKGQLPLMVGKKTKLCLYLNTNKNKILQHGNASSKAFDKSID